MDYAILYQSIGDGDKNTGSCVHGGGFHDCLYRWVFYGVDCRTNL